MEISQPLAEVEWIPRPRVLALRRLGIETVEDLLTHFPRRHEDRHQFPEFPREESDVAICLCGQVVKTSLRRFGGRKIFEATLQEPNPNALSQPLVCRWFNLHYVQKMIATDQRLVVFGRPKLRGKRICMDHPEFEVIEDDAETSIHFRRITPIYPATEGLSQRVLRSIIYRVLDELPDTPLETLLPPELANGDDEAVRTIHFPTDWESLRMAREHLVLAEFFAMQMLIGSRRAESSARIGAAHCGQGELLKKFVAALPFELTEAQERVIAELRRDLAGDRAMNRLLQGDVGSGKTVVAIAAILFAIEDGYQAAFMAPTQILAEQHYTVLRQWLEPLGVRLSIRTGARQEESGPLPLFAAASAKVLGSTGCQPVTSGSLPDASRNVVQHEIKSATAADKTSCQVAEKNGLAACAPQNSGIGESLYHRRHLPHFERPWAKYAITFATRNHRQLSAKARDIVLESLLRWKDRRYELYAACVMPDHVHMLIEPMVERQVGQGKTVSFSLSKILHSIKSFTSNRINKIDNASGALWETESFDRLIRSEGDLQEKFCYITRNPWDAGVVRPGNNYRWLWYVGAENTKNVAAGCRDQQAGSLCSPESWIPRRDAPHVIVGTHALLYENVSFTNLGLVVIDEQHKFGVAQRARLTSREPAPDVLVMTATPIPRTLTMTVYGDLDVSVIDEMPHDRGKVVTAVRDQSKLGEVLGFLRAQFEAGRQAYVVYPLIDESDKLDVKAAAAEYKLWHERLHPFRCELLHGRIPAPEKQQIMERFRQGETQALITTTVIEVGVDVANATVILVENADRFGLAQLHQLRGRIGRGKHKSYCILLASDPSKETAAKLAVLEKTSNGFEVAEADWDLRGPGDLLGTAQSGLPALKIGDLRRDAHLMRRARAAVMSIFQRDPRLESPQNQRFRQLIVEQEGRTFSNIS